MPPDQVRGRLSGLPPPIDRDLRQGWRRYDGIIVSEDGGESQRGNDRQGDKGRGRQGEGQNGEAKKLGEKKTYRRGRKEGKERTQRTAHRTGPDKKHSDKSESTMRDLHFVPIGRVGHIGHIGQNRKS